MITKTHELHGRSPMGADERSRFWTHADVNKRARLPPMGAVNRAQANAHISGHSGGLPWASMDSYLRPQTPTDVRKPYGIVWRLTYARRKFATLLQNRSIKHRTFRQ